MLFESCTGLLEIVWHCSANEKKRGSLEFYDLVKGAIFLSKDIVDNLSDVRRGLLAQLNVISLKRLGDTTSCYFKYSLST